MKSTTTAFALLIVPLLAVAQSTDNYECTMGELTRRVVVEREGTAPLPCEVVYYKDTETPGEREVLWNAANDASYCGARASEFRSRLESLGWQCAATNAGTQDARNEE